MHKYLAFVDDIVAVLAPYLGLRPSQIWPISTESAPTILSFWLVFASIYYFCFLREGSDPVYAAAQKKRSEIRSKKLCNMIFLENERLEKKRQTSKNKTEHKSGEKTEDKDDKPPEARNLLEFILDKIAEEPVTKALEISEDDPWYHRAGIYGGRCIGGPNVIYGVDRSRIKKLGQSECALSQLPCFRTPLEFLLT